MLFSSVYHEKTKNSKSSKNELLFVHLERSLDINAEKDRFFLLAVQRHSLTAIALAVYSKIETHCKLYKNPP